MITMTPQLNVNANIAQSNVNNIIFAIEDGRANEFVTNKSANTLVNKANKVITRIDTDGEVSVLSTVAVVDNEDNTRTYSVIVKVSGNNEDTAEARGEVTTNA